MISVDNLAVAFSGQRLFSGISFVINENDKIALMGKNGAGKSTIMKIIAGVQKPSAGSVNASKGSVIAYLPQHLLTEDDCTVFEETMKAFKQFFTMKNELDRLNTELGSRTDYDSDAYMKIIEKAADLGEKFYSIEEINYDKQNIEYGKVLETDNNTIVVKTYDSAIRVLEHEFEILPKVGEYL